MIILREGKFTIGVDFGTDSVRAIVVDGLTGDVLATGFSEYERWKTGLFCNAEQSISATPFGLSGKS